MKKIALFPVAALLFLGACSDDEEQRPVPNDPVQTVAPVADDVTLNAPALTDIKADGSNFRASYANNQEIVYSLASHATQGYIAIVKRIEGSAADVVVPASVSYNGNDFKVYCLDLYVDGISDNVTSLTLPSTAVAMVKNDNYVAADAAYLRAQFERGHSLTKIELENGFRGYSSINGAVYTDNLETLVSVPRAAAGTFTVADGTTTIDDRAFYYCQSLDVITFPASVESIGSEAVTFTDNLLLINSLATVPPTCPEDAFGKYAHDGVLRVPAAAKDAYTPAKPDVEEPVVPAEPAEDASDEEWDKYYDDLDAYTAAKAEYDEIMEAYNAVAGWLPFHNIEGVTF